MMLPSCLTYTGSSICASAIDYPVYVSGSDPTQIGSAELLVDGFAFLNNLVPKSCVDEYYKLMCYTAFPKYGFLRGFEIVW